MIFPIGAVPGSASPVATAPRFDPSLFWTPALNWSPLSLPNLLGYYDASISSSIAQISGSVSQWSDLSGAANHLVQATGANQPAAAGAAINGLNTLGFNGTSSYLSFTTAISGASLSAFLVCGITHPGNNNYNDFLGSAGGAWWGFFQGTYGLYGGSVTSASTSTNPTSTPSLYACTLAAGNNSTYIDTVSDTSGAAGTFSTSFTYLGQRQTGNWLAANVAMLCLVSGALSGPNLAKMNSYCDSRWGLGF